MYDELPTGTSIRLLDFGGESSNGSSEESITTTLRIHDLEDRPTFSALSYTWVPPYRGILGEDVDAPSRV
jgi:hypothetical protein